MANSWHLFFNIFLLSVVLLEFIYSKVKKDGKHSTQDTLVNTSSFVIGLLIRHYVLSVFYIGFFISLIYSFVKEYIDPLSNSAINFILCFTLLDFIFYVVHRMHHSFSFLWAVHSTHHSDNYLNTGTFLRSSWVQKTYQWVFLTIPLFLGFPQSMVLLCLVFIYSYQLVVHSQYVHFPKWIDRFLVTSRSHSLHHDEAVKNQSCNYGEVFNVWDVMFRTYKYKREDTRVTFGILEKDKNTLLSIQTSGLKKYFAPHMITFKKSIFRARIPPL